MPNSCSGSFIASLLERRRRVDQALFALVMEAYLHAASTRKTVVFTTTSPGADQSSSAAS